jgi:hypothetical protein
VRPLSEEPVVPLQCIAIVDVPAEELRIPPSRPVGNLDRIASVEARCDRTGFASPARNESDATGHGTGAGVLDDAQYHRSGRRPGSDSGDSARRCENETLGRRLPADRSDVAIVGEARQVVATRCAAQERSAETLDREDRPLPEGIAFPDLQDMLPGRKVRVVPEQDEGVVVIAADGPGVLARRPIGHLEALPTVEARVERGVRLAFPARDDSDTALGALPTGSLEKTRILELRRGRNGRQKESEQTRESSAHEGHC